jgi:hypothetical protein
VSDLLRSLLAALASYFAYEMDLELSVSSQNIPRGDILSFDTYLRTNIRLKYV